MVVGPDGAEQTALRIAFRQPDQDTNFCGDEIPTQFNEIILTRHILQSW
jgi:hypothetical protein